MDEPEQISPESIRQPADQEPIEQPSQPEPVNISFEPIVWQAEEFEVYQRDWKWYLIFIVVEGGLLAYLIYTKQWILAVMAVVIGGLLLISGRLRPRLMQYQIDPQGLTINGRTFPFDKLKSFWLHDKTGKSYLNVISVLRLMPVITVRINSDDKAKIRGILGKFLPESGHKDEDWIDRINHFLKV